MSRREVERRFDDIVAFAEIGEFIDNQVKHYSSGMSARLGFAVAVNVEPDILLVDEVLAVGDEAFQRKCRDRIKRFQREGRTILVVTHAADLVRQICDRAVVLDQGETVMVGEPAEGVLAYRDALMRRGVILADVDTARILTNAVKITDVRIEYPGSSRGHVISGESVRVVIVYEAAEPIADVVFAINIYDRQGNLLLGTNTELLGIGSGRRVGLRRARVRARHRPAARRCVRDPRRHPQLGRRHRVRPPGRQGLPRGAEPGRDDRAGQLRARAVVVPRDSSRKIS